jgi:two-component system sensor histidine kinase MtrB
MALSAYFITKAAQDDEALEKALAQSRFNLFLADSMLPAGPAPTDYDQLLAAFEIRGEFATLIEAGDEVYVSGPQVTKALVTPELAARVADGHIGYQMITMTGQPTIAVGGQVRSPGFAVYNFYPQGPRLAELGRLRNVLIVAGITLALLGMIGGYWLARRLTGPVREASRAAVLVSRGDLDVRLPAGSDEFGALGASFNLMAENLRARMLDLETGQARERRFVADVAHELRTPVSALVGETSLLKARLESDPGGCPSDIRRLALMVSADISRLRQLVDDLLEISRLEAEAADTTVETLDLRAFLPQVVRAHGWTDSVRLVAEQNQVGSADSPGSDASGPFVDTDKRRLERIVVNLVENALLHGAQPVVLETWSEPGTDPVAGSQTGKTVFIAVTDNGPGIPDDHLQHVFDRFYKVDPSRSTSPGSGLGLAIARENARLLGGDLSAANTPGTGARFVLSLPA